MLYVTNHRFDDPHQYGGVTVKVKVFILKSIYIIYILRLQYNAQYFRRHFNSPTNPTPPPCAAYMRQLVGVSIASDNCLVYKFITKRQKNTTMRDKAMCRILGMGWNCRETYDQAKILQSTGIDVDQGSLLSGELISNKLCTCSVADWWLFHFGEDEKKNHSLAVAEWHQMHCEW